MIIITNSIDTPENNNQINKPELRKKLILDRISTKGHVILVDTLINELWLSNLHDVAYLDFLKNCYQSFVEANDGHWGFANELVPLNFFKRRPTQVVPLYKMSGYYGSDYMTPINANTYSNTMISAQQAYEAALYVINNEDNLIYVATSCPGHHAKTSEYGGYCFVNNAVVAAYKLLTEGKKVSILDLDYHAGNGTAEMVATNNKLTEIDFCSIHCDPAFDYPSHEGFADDYPNSNVFNFPLKPATTWEEYAAVLQTACQIICLDRDSLVISFGADTYKLDPDASILGQFGLEVGDYYEMGRLIRSHFDKQIIVVQEGGYDMDWVGEIVDNFLRGLRD